MTKKKSDLHKKSEHSKKNPGRRKILLSVNYNDRNSENIKEVLREIYFGA